MNRAKFVALLALAPVILAGCGGGGDSSAPAAAPTSYWTMDSRLYANGGTSSTSSTVSGGRTLKVVAMSTATLSGGDTSNGAYSGSSLSVIYQDNGPGTYAVVPDRASLVTVPAGTRAIVVEVIVGIAVTTGATQYVAASGNVTVTVDAGGKPHFSATALPTVKGTEVSGGVAGAPASMSLTVVDAY